MFKDGQVERQRFILDAHTPNQWNHSGVLFHGIFHYIKIAPRNYSANNLATLCSRTCSRTYSIFM